MKKRRWAPRARAFAVWAALAAAGVSPFTATRAEATPLPAAAIELAPVAGYNVTHPRLIEDARGLVVRGRVCRRLSAGPLRSLLVERLEPDGTVIGAAVARVYPYRLWRKPECVRFAVKTGWHLEAGDVVRISAPQKRTPTGG